MEKQSLQIGKGIRQDCILSPCLFNFYAEYIMRNAGLNEAQAGINISRRNINNLRYADGTTLMAESEEELKSLLMKVKEESEKAGLKLNILETYITICKIDSQQGFAVWLRKIKPGLNLEGWGGEGDGREVQKGGDICTPMADSYWGLTENNKIL